MTKIIRDTKQRAAIRDAFKNAGFRILSIAEVLETASKKVPNLGIATVYRNIGAMKDAGEIGAVVLPGQPDRYTLSASHSPCDYIWIRKDGSVWFDPSQSAKVPGTFVQRTYFIEK